MKVNVQALVDLQNAKTDIWHQQPITIGDDPWLSLVEQNHRFNYELWHHEDNARRDDKGFEFVYKAKRKIDRCNQQRNDYMEKMDRYLVEQLHPRQDKAVPFHSETPGMIIDRLSILALKRYHMHLQTERTDVAESHRQQCCHKLSVIETQQKDLAQALDDLLVLVEQGKRSFRVYYQFKMYNDPTLNPQLYKKGG